MWFDKYLTIQPPRDLGHETTTVSESLFEKKQSPLIHSRGIIVCTPPGRDTAAHFKVRVFWTLSFPNVVLFGFLLLEPACQNEILKTGPIGFILTKDCSIRGVLLVAIDKNL